MKKIEPPKPDISPVKFPQVNFTFTAPHGMDNCDSLHVCHIPHMGLNLSCWRISPIARIRLLFTGKLWLGVMMQGHPPVYITSRNPWKGQPKPKKE